MRLKELLNTVEHTELYVYRIDENDQYETLAMPDVRNGFDKYHEECEKIRELIKKDEYVVKKIGLLDARDGSCIYIECEKEGA